RDVLLKLCRVDWMTEPNRSNDFFQIGIDGILIELAFGEPGGERSSLKVEAVLIQLHATRKETFLGKADPECGVDRPVVFRSKSKVFVANPRPRSGDRRCDLNAGCDSLFDLG